MHSIARPINNRFRAKVRLIKTENRKIPEYKIVQSDLICKTCHNSIKHVFNSILHSCYYANIVLVFTIDDRLSV